MPDEKTLRANPFETYPDGPTVVWYDPDNAAFYRGPADPDGPDDADEYPTYAALVAAAG